MSHRLQSGAQVEVLTSDKQKPQSDWLDFIVTAKARNNILMVFRREKKEQIRIGTTMYEKLLEDIVRTLKIGEKLENLPEELSGGQQQRVAIARALMVKPAVLLCDEPTGNLDSASSEVVIHTLEEINKKMGKTILLVTHDPIIASSCDRIIFLKDGKVKEDLKRTGDKEQFYNEIITNWC